MTTTRPLGLQLYTVRDLLQQDFRGTVQRVADIGYAGVETISFPEGISPADARQLFDDLGLQVVSAHSPLPVGDNKNGVLDSLAMLGTAYLVCAWLSPEEYFSSLAGVQRACDLLNSANEAVQAAGLTLLYHNHWFEYEPVEGKLPYQIMLEQLDPSIGFEVDTYWVRTGGQDPVAVVEGMGKCAPLLHIKDGPAENKDQSMLPAGTGVMDFPAIVEKAAAEWLLIEMDRYEGDMMEAVAQSYEYMVETGLAHGRA